LSALPPEFWSDGEMGDEASEGSGGGGSGGDDDLTPPSMRPFDPHLHHNMMADDEWEYVVMSAGWIGLVWFGLVGLGWVGLVVVVVVVCTSK